MVDELEKLNAKVTETEGAEASTIVLVQGISEFIKKNFTYSVGMLIYANRLEELQIEIAKAVVANPIPPAVSETV